MKFPIVLSAAFTLFTLISCNSPKQESKQTQQAPALPQNQEQITVESTDSVQPVEGETAEQPSTEQNNAEVMLNPPHGEPNHRCDIPVGAPLNSSPVNSTRQTTNDQIQATTPGNVNNPTAPTIENARRMNSSQTQSTTTPAKAAKPTINPPHGQPYHRCDIAVGSPLP